MGQQDVRKDSDEVALREFTQHLIKDVRALERMLREGLFETGVRRIGAEQELFLVDERGKPGAIIDQVLEHNSDDRIVTELTRFNLEFNMEPISFGDGCLREMEQANRELIGTVREMVHRVGGDIIQTGILQTIQLAELTLDYMTPRPRYYALNDAITRLRGGPGQFQIRGVDELFMKHDTIMLEGCNTSFQTHFQVSPDEFPRFYNIAQAVAGPCLAAATNSPLLFGKRLWRETRIALFEQAVDTRSSNLYLREMSPRVHFGSGWVRESVTEIFKEDISRFRVLITTDLKEENPLQKLEQGDVPQLEALQLHNGTVYRWNRACYGITEGKPHLRIENRILPSGPSTVDQIANAAFWFGLVSGLASKYDDIAEAMAFDDAKSNFIAAARHGLASQFTWINGEQVPAHDLILNKLLPLAEDGLRASDIDEEDIERYLGIIEQRVQTRKTGSQWQLQSLAQMADEGTRAERLGALVAGMIRRQKEGKPVHEWSLATLDEGYSSTRMQASFVEDYMSTDLFTVHEQETAEFVAYLMDWQHIRHVLVEDERHRLVGLVSHRSLLRHLAERDTVPQGGVPVGEIMVRDPVSVRPDLPTVEAIKIMRSRKIGALPVVRDDQLVGIITQHDFIDLAGQLLEKTNNGEPFKPKRSETAPSDE
jgi:CBS domain-containing protein